MKPHIIAGVLAVILAAGLRSLVEAQPYTITGTVVAADDGQPIAGAAVSAVQAGRQAVALRTAVTDTAGSFSIRLEGTAGAVLVARAHGHGFQMFHVLPSGRALRIPLQKAGTISGVIEETTGIPARGLSVTIAYARDVLERPLPVGVHGGSPYTDSSGMYRVTNLRPDSLFIVQALRNGVVVGESSPVRVAAGGVRTVSFNLDPTGGMRGRVIDEGHIPVRDAAVRFWIRRESDGLFHTTRSRMLSSMTGADGSFDLVSVPEGSGTLMVSKRGFAWALDTTPLTGNVAELPVTVTLKRGK